MEARLAIECFRRAERGERLDALPAAVAGLRLVIRDHLETQSSVEVSLAAELRSAIFDAAAVIVEITEPRIDAGTVWMGLAAAAALASTADPLTPDRVAYAEMLAARLTVELHRACIAARGDPLMRMIAMRRAEATPRGVAILH